MSTNMIMLIIARAFMGIGTGGMISIPFIIYADMYPNPAQRAKALSWVTASYTLSTVVGPLVGGWLVDALSWHWIFYINVPIGLLTIILLQIFYQENRKEIDDRSFDFAGSILMIVMLSVLLFASDALATSFVRAGILFVIGIIFAILFYRVESKRGLKAMIPVKLLSDWKIQSQNLIMFLLNGFFIGYSIYAPMWAQGLLGTNAMYGGLTQIASSILLLIGTRYTASLMAKFPYKRIVMAGSISVLISAIAMILATKNAPYWWLMVSGAFEGLGIGLAFTPMQVSIQDGVSFELISISTTFGLLARSLGQTFMSAIYGAVLSLVTTTQIHGAITSDMMNKLTDPTTAASLPQKLIPEMRTILFNGFHWIMIIGLVLVVIALLINWFRKEPEKQAR